MTWSAPQFLNTNDETGLRDEYDPRVASDAAGNWIVVWEAFDSLEALEFDADILFARSTDRGGHVDGAGCTQCERRRRTRAMTSTRTSSTDRAGNWLVIWQANNEDGGSGSDFDLFAHTLDPTPAPPGARRCH